MKLIYLLILGSVIGLLLTQFMPVVPPLNAGILSALDQVAISLNIANQFLDVDLLLLLINLVFAVEIANMVAKFTFWAIEVGSSI